MARLSLPFFFFFFNDTATTEIYTLSLHDALPISARHLLERHHRARRQRHGRVERRSQDRKSTRLNSSHSQISYAVFCLKKKKTHPTTPHGQIGHPHPSRQTNLHQLGRPRTTHTAT